MDVGQLAELGACCCVEARRRRAFPDRRRGRATQHHAAITAITITTILELAKDDYPTSHRLLTALATA